ncbi:hypothetical protein B296_00019898 [Ensete ventricosum]|uniref:Uncharacterized protein n=1 Tax=Ensete ventricosum TaxID=4639 RepID=A0A427AAA6_ENSVE|nr:hypothetical protein B296_00019898 [Ensete ventricosum]
MINKQKYPTSGSFIHPHFSEVCGGRRASRALSIISFTISSKGLEYPTNTRVQKDMSNKRGIYQKYMQNNEIYI